MNKAIILAAGFGTRLKPITDTTPKCLVTIKDIPLLEWWLKNLEKHGFKEVLINTHYLHEKVEDYINNQYHGKIKVTLIYEEELLGSAGTIRNNSYFYENEDDFAIIYADNLTDIDLSKMIKFHHDKNAIFTCGVFHTNKPKECGILATNDEGVVIEFEEKPKEPKSDLANGGIYIVNKACYPYFIDGNKFDIGKEVLPLLVNKMYAYPINEYLLDIGSLDNLEKARREWKYDDNF